MVEFASNSLVSAITGFAPFEPTYGYMPRWMPMALDTTQFKGVHEFAERATSNLALAHDTIVEAQVNQTHYANKQRREEPEFEKNSYVYLSTKNLNLPKGRAKKLLPWYIGLYKILQAWLKTFNYQLELPQELLNRRIHDKFQVLLLRPYHENNSQLFPGRNANRIMTFVILTRMSSLSSQSRDTFGKRIKFAP